MPVITMIAFLTSGVCCSAMMQALLLLDDWPACGIQISFTRLTDGESVVTYGYLSTVGGGGKSFSLSRSFAANNVGIQSPTNHNLTVNATAKMRMNPNQASHPQPGMVNPSMSMITPAPPTKSGRRYCDGLLFGLFIV
jgi:hypothetical protein